MVGRYEYDMGGDRGYGFQYGDIFDGAELKYQNDKFAATAGYGKFKEGVIMVVKMMALTLMVKRLAMAN